MNLTRAALPLSLLFTALSGCSGSPEEMAPPPVGGTNGQPLCLKTDLLPIEPGKEATRCVTARLPTDAPMEVVQIDTKQHSTHHVIFYREQPDTPEQATHDCQALDIFDDRFQVVREPLFIGETPEAQLRMPPGVSYSFAPGAVYTIEVHYFNPGTETRQAQGEVCLTPAAPGAKLVPADMLFYASVTALSKRYDGTDRGLPPGQVTTLDPPGFHTPPEEIKVFGLTSHQHRTGTEFTIYKSKGRSEEGQMLLRNTDWEHPTLLRFPDDQLLTFQQDEGLRWTCTYNNTNDFHLTFGQSAYRNEMCILWAYYYPGKGFDLHFE